jgi:hypothetical protein
MLEIPLWMVALVAALGIIAWSYGRDPDEGEGDAGGARGTW